MSGQELLSAIIGIMAYDKGCTDSGIRNEMLRQQCQDEINRRRSENGDPLTKLFTKHVHEITAPESPYDIEDAAEFIAYLGDSFDWDSR